MGNVILSFLVYSTNTGYSAAPVNRSKMRRVRVSKQMEQWTVGIEVDIKWSVELHFRSLEKMFHNSMKKVRWWGQSPDEGDFALHWHGPRKTRKMHEACWKVMGRAYLGIALKKNCIFCFGGWKGSERGLHFIFFFFFFSCGGCSDAWVPLWLGCLNGL